ncbi:hypothetical protein G9A89_008639 [Geosiphon pyriformis]|nr:hypothetical protein G9A89_008639 [Geosiphon pyriformis]
MRLTRALFDVAKKTTTGLYGLPVHSNPRPHLIKTYNETLKILSELPSTAVYRQATEALTQHRLSVVEATENVEEIEKNIAAGQIEEIIWQAEDEKKLSEKIKEWRPWQPLETPPPAGQWN